MQSAYLAMVYVAILTMGAAAPFVLSLGYIWVDVFSPQQVASALLNALPVSLIMAVAALGSYLLADRKSPPRLTAITVLILCMAVWVTLTTTWAVAPELAWSKWDWAFKNLLVAAFLPFVFRSRVQIEAFLMVFVLSVAAHFIPFGAKNLLGGGGYGKNVGLIAGNSGIAEGSTFAGLCVATIPLMLYFKDNGMILPRARWVALMWWGLIGAAVSAVIATYERTGLIALAVIGLHIWATSKRKALVGGLLAGIVFAGSALLASSYADRISTIGSYSADSSAYGRVLVWRWTLGFAVDHPLGGGFNAYVVDSLSAPMEDGTVLEIHGKAFHSIIFEALGEHGWPGLALLISLLSLSTLSFWRVARAAVRVPGAEWSGALATQMIGSLAALTTGGLFVSNGFQPEFPYMYATAVCLSEYLRRAAAASEAPTGPVWRRAQLAGRTTGAARV